MSLWSRQPPVGERQPHSNRRACHAGRPTVSCGTGWTGRRAKPLAIAPTTNSLPTTPYDTLESSLSLLKALSMVLSLSNRESREKRGLLSRINSVALMTTWTRHLRQRLATLNFWFYDTSNCLDRSFTSFLRLQWIIFLFTGVFKLWYVCICVARENALSIKAKSTCRIIWWALCPRFASSFGHLFRGPGGNGPFYMPWRCQWRREIFCFALSSKRHLFWRRLGFYPLGFAPDAFETLGSE